MNTPLNLKIGKSLASFNQCCKKYVFHKPKGLYSNKHYNTLFQNTPYKIYYKTKIKNFNFSFSPHSSRAQPDAREPHVPTARPPRPPSGDGTQTGSLCVTPADSTTSSTMYDNQTMLVRVQLLEQTWES